MRNPVIAKKKREANKILIDKTNSANYSYNSEFDRMINEIDKQILNILQQDARISNVEIARQVGLAPSAVLERVKKLEERGVIKGFETKLDGVQLDFGLTAFVAVRTHDCCAETDKFLAEIPEVLEVHDVAGEDSYFLKVRVKDTEHLSRLLRERLKNVPNVASTKTTIVLQTIKETTALPIDEGAETEEKQKRREKKSK
jgi:Lrp/AsnC family leucine-responsive transcriptional regulator